jgi:hypothetical protein
MKPTGKLVDATITTDYERWLSCPAIQAARKASAMGLQNEIPFELVAGKPIKIYMTPLAPDQGHFASECELTHWPVWVSEFEASLGHTESPWVCAHMADIPD